MQKIHKITITYLIITPLFVLAGCATPPQGVELVDNPNNLKSIQQKNSERLSKIETGMQLDKFRTIFPEAYVGGQNKSTTAYEIVNFQKYVTQGDITRHNILWGMGSPKARAKKQTLWFYFYKNRLVRWGLPQDWPSPADITIETRNR